MFFKTFFVFLFTVVSCTSTPKNNNATFQEKDAFSHPIKRFQELAVEKYKTDIEYIFNEGKEYVLCLSASKPTTLKPEHSIRFFVYDVKKDTVVIEETYADGTVRWISDRAIEVTYRLGVSSSDPAIKHGETYTFDIVTKQKTFINKTENK